MKHSKAGFTLIEIVMVLVLLGILAAVAVPKYFDLQEKAEVQAAKAMVAEVQARINGEFANKLLDQGATCTQAVEAVKTALTSGITVTKGYSISVDMSSGTNGVYPVTVSKGEDPNKKAVYTEGKVAVPTCNP